MLNRVIEFMSDPKNANDPAILTYLENAQSLLPVHANEPAIFIKNAPSLLLLPFPPSPLPENLTATDVCEFVKEISDEISDLQSRVDHISQSRGKALRSIKENHDVITMLSTSWIPNIKKMISASNKNSQTTTSGNAAPLTNINAAITEIETTIQSVKKNNKILTAYCEMASSEQILDIHKKIQYLRQVVANTDAAKERAREITRFELNFNNKEPVSAFKILTQSFMKIMDNYSYFIGQIEDQQSETQSLERKLIDMKSEISKIPAASLKQRLFSSKQTATAQPTAQPRPRNNSWF